MSKALFSHAVVAVATMTLCGALQRGLTPECNLTSQSPFQTRTLEPAEGPHQKNSKESELDIVAVAHSPKMTVQHARLLTELLHLSMTEGYVARLQALLTSPPPQQTPEEILVTVKLGQTCQLSCLRTWK